MGNALATINSDSLLQIAPIMSFGDLLQGRSPGVLSLQESGYSGASGRIRIRGLNSLNVSNDPIVVVDGVRVEAGAGTGGASAALNADAGGRTGRLADFDPDEIASVEIVKGPSAATLYGTDAANGVIVITTKRGQMGRARWSAFTEQGLQTQGLDLTDAFPGAYYAFGRSTLDDSPQRCTLLQRAEGSCVADSLRFFNAFTDPETRPLKDSWRHQYGLQLSGGTTGGTTYFLSGNYEQETGPAYMPVIDQEIIRTTQGRDVPDWQVRPNAVERVNLRANVTAPLGQRGNFTVATGFVSNQARQPVQGLPRGQVGYRNENDGWDDFGGIFNLRPAYNFPWRGQDVVRRFMGSLATTYSARDWLALRGTMGADLSTDAYSDLLRRGEGPYIGILSFINTGSLRANELNIARYSLDLGATATRNLSEAWSSRTSVGLQYNRRSQRGVTARASDLPIGGETSAGGTVCAFCYREVTLTTAVAGGYVEEMLGLNDRLFVTGALRFDGGSTFGRDFSVATYPKAHLSWVLTNGDVGPRLPGVSALRLRAAYGAAGVQPGPTDALERVEVRTGYSLDGSGTAPGGVLIAGNADLKPERSTELDAGLDLELWQSRVRLEFTGYHRASKDALIRRLNAASVGGERIENLGSVQNQGLELVLSADLVQNRILAAGFTLTGGLNENELRKLGEGVLVSSPADEFTRNEEGYPLYGLWGYTVESFDDANGNGIIEPTEVVMTGPNSHFIGATVPTREATLAPYVKLFGERLHLSTLLQYRGGFYRTNSPAWEPCFSGACRAVSDPAAPLEDQARAVAYTVFGRWGPTIEDGSYLRLRELSLGFTAPPAVSRLLRAQAGQLTLAGRNLAALWKASSLPMETAELSADIQSPYATPGTPGSTTYWMLRVHLTY
jgi:TonB-dependent SusC/RagA subfamily outer membrane receptor